MQKKRSHSTAHRAEIAGLAWPVRLAAGPLVRRLLPANADPTATVQRTRLGLIEGWISTVISIFLSVVKFVFGFLSGSVSLIADATNNLADVGSSLAVALSFHWSRKPKDRKHPFGHGRIESVATLILSVAFLVVGLEVGKAGFLRILSPAPLQVTTLTLTVMVLTIVIKAWLAAFAVALARLTRSQVLEADAWNHTFDILCSLLVLAALFSDRFGWQLADGLAGLAVAGFILYTGVAYAREAIDSLLGSAPTSQELDRMRELVLSVPGIRNVHDIIRHDYGDTSLVSFHIEVDADQTVMEAHALSEQAEDILEQTCGCRAIAHIDPVDRSHPHYHEVEAAVRELVQEQDRILSYHDLRIEDDNGMRISLDLVVRLGPAPQDTNVLPAWTGDRLKQRFPQLAQVDVGIETELASAPMQRQTHIPSSAETRI